MIELSGPGARQASVATGHYPAPGGAVVERMFLSARSMANFMITPEGAVSVTAGSAKARGSYSRDQSKQ